MSRVNVLHPLDISKFASCRDESDSQGSLDLINLEIERQMMIHVCCIDKPCFNVAMLTWIAIAQHHLARLSCNYAGHPRMSSLSTC